jgi:hypothetical protein
MAVAYTTDSTACNVSQGSIADTGAPASHLASAFAWLRNSSISIRECCFARGTAVGLACRFRAAGMR